MEVIIFIILVMLEKTLLLRQIISDNFHALLIYFADYLIPLLSFAEVDGEAIVELKDFSL